MNQMIELFDGLLVQCARYPATLGGLLGWPSRILSAPYRGEACPPGITFVFTLILGFIIINIFAKGTIDLPEWADKELLLGLVIAYYAVIVNIQHWALGKVCSLSVAAEEQLKLLFYPVAIALLATAILVIAARRLEPTYTLVAVILVHVLYFWSLFNVCLYAFELSWKQALAGAAVAQAALLAVTFIYLITALVAMA